MNLHVTNDNYGLYPTEVAKRIKASGNQQNNLIVNLLETSQIRDPIISYISISGASFKNYIDQLPLLEKIFFHPYNVNSPRFLTYVLKRFPQVKVYWVCWSYELYYHPKFTKMLYEPFAAAYLEKNDSTYQAIRSLLKKPALDFLHFTGIHRKYPKGLIPSYKRIDYFCSFLPSDFQVFLSLSHNTHTQYVPFSYLSLDKIMPGLHSFDSSGDEIMIGHSSWPSGNHYEILEKLGSIDPEFSIFLPLAYGDKDYGDIIKNKAITTFKNVRVLEEKLESEAYYKRLTQVGWAIINAKVQQALGNIMALIWMGVKLFLDKNTGTYHDFKAWGIIIFSVQDDLTKSQLSEKLTPAEIENNKRLILQRFNEEQVNNYWQPLFN